MTFSESIKSGFKRVRDYSSRSTRSEFWWCVLAGILWMFGLIIVQAAIDLDALVNPSSSSFLSVVGGLSGLVWAIILLALSVRRLHDVNRSGLWILLLYIPFGIAVLIYFFCCEGTPHANRFGPDSKAPFF